MSDIKCAYLENIVIFICATFLAYEWDTAWPFMLVMLCNNVKTKVVRK